jgi:ribosomal protein S18 acetylase RimI-like enzyme
MNKTNNTNNTHKITCIEVNKIKNPELLANIAFNNFSYLTKFPELMHTKKDIVKTLQSDGNLCFLIYDGDNLIGYLIGDYRTLPDSRYAYYISYVFVSEKYRGKKLGTKLMDLLINKCKQSGTKFIVLTCDTLDSKVTQFYKKYGFVIDPILGNRKRHEVFCLYL